VTTSLQNIVTESQSYALAKSERLALRKKILFSGSIVELDHLSFTKGGGKN